MADRYDSADDRKMTDAQFAELVILYIDKAATPGQAARLEAELRRSERRRKQYVEACQRGWAMHELFSSPECLDEHEVLARIEAYGSNTPRAQRRRKPSLQPLRLIMQMDHRVRWIAAAACVVLCGLLAVYFVSNATMNGSGNRFPETIRYSYGQDAVWSGQSLEPSQKMEPGRYQLTSGMALVHFPSGAEVLFQAPASFELVSDNEITLDEGTLTARCDTPASKGFKVQTPQGSVVDLGTEFAVRVDRYAVQVGVYQGKVALSGAEQAELMTGEAAIMDATGIASVPAGLTDAGVTRIDAFLARLNAADGSANNAWLNAGYQYAEEPALLTWIDISREGDLSWISDRTTRWGDAARLELPASMAFDRDRYERMAAIQVHRPEEAIGIDIAQAYTSMTLSAWVYFESEQTSDERHRAILMSEQWSRVGAVHWQRRGSGVRVEIYSPQTTDANKVLRFMAGSDQLVQSGWHHLVTVIDGHQQQVTQYINGDLVAREKAKVTIPPLLVGEATIGAWQLEETDKEKRALNGAIDDFMVWRRVLQPDEVKGLYQASAPR